MLKNKHKRKTSVELRTTQKKQTVAASQVYNLENTLPKDKLFKTEVNCLKSISGYAEINESELVATSRGLYSIFQPKRLAQALLTAVAQGNQNKAERMPHLRLLLEKGDVTDYSYRHFKQITPYQYALWALDEHMVRMIENKAQHATGQEGIDLRKALLAQRNVLKTKGINYILNSTLYCEVAFDPQQLFDAYQFYIDNYDDLQAADRKVDLKEAFSTVGGQQKLLPAHVIQEMCSTQHEFSTKITFKEDKLDRNFEIYNIVTRRNEKVFPLNELLKNNMLYIDITEKWSPTPSIILDNLNVFKKLFSVRNESLSHAPDWSLCTNHTSFLRDRSGQSN